MRKTLSKIMTLGAVVSTTMALDIHSALSAGPKHADGHSIVIDEHGAVDSGHGHGDHHAEVEGLPQLDFSTYTSQIFWMFVAFIILYVFFAKKTLPEISGTVENRREKVEGDLDSAQELKEKAEQVQGEYEDALKEAREKASKLFTKAEDDIKADSNAKLEAFKDRSNKLTQSTEKKLNKAKEAALDDTQSVAAEIATIAAKKILGVSTDLKKAETLVKNINKKAA